jgi:Flp pilus assembly protein TadG
VLVEFALSLFLLLVLVFGMIDLGHAFYLRHMATNASREGARYGVAYCEDANGNRVAPINLNPSIANYLLNGCLTSACLPADANPTVTVSGGGCTTGTCGAPIEVTVSVVKTWFVLDNFIPSLNEQMTMSATTVMRCE